MQFFENYLINLGFSTNSAMLLNQSLLIVILLLISFIFNLFAKKILLTFIKHIILKTKTNWDDILLKRKVFDRLSQIVPALIIHSLAKVAFPYSEFAAELIQRLAMSYMILISVLVIDSVLNALIEIYRNYDLSKRKPINTYVQVVKIFIYIVSTIFVISTLLNNSPWGLLSSLGAMTAIIMLIFKDSILGFVASIQLSTLNLVQRGDWIEMPKYGADGDIIEINLNTIKVQNWDKTISTIPTYSLISESFKNWRGMSESGGRRIKRSFNIDMNTIKFCSEELLTRLEKVHLLKDYINTKREELCEYNLDKNIDTHEIINGRRMTNIGTLRAYIIAYLKAHPKIHKNMTFLVRHLTPDQNGLPIEISVFSNDQVWANYEAIQADIFDHILAVVKEFDLRVFQNPSGNDLQQLIKK